MANEEAAEKEVAVNDDKWEALGEELDSLVHPPQLRAAPKTIEDMAQRWVAAMQKNPSRVSDLLVSENLIVVPEQYTVMGVEMISFSSNTTEVQIDAAFARNGVQDASIEHLIAFGEKYENELLGGPIIARGFSLIVGQNHRYNPCLAMLEGVRVLGLVRRPNPGNNWSYTWRFLGVRKPRMAEGEGRTWTFADVRPTI